MNNFPTRFFRGATAIFSAAIVMQCAISAARPAPAPAKGSLFVECDPAGAEIAINHSSKHEAPAAIELAPGEYVLSLAKNGFQTSHKKILIVQGETTSIKEKLEPLTGLLIVNSSPAGAEIEIGGVAFGVTPALISSLPLGKHTIALRLPGFYDKTLEANLSDRAPVKLNCDLMSDSATLTLKSPAAPGARVSLNGVVRGNTPLTIEKIPAGETVVEVAAEGFMPFTQILKLAAGEVLDLNIPLVEKPASLQIVSIPDGARVYLNNEYKGTAPQAFEGLAAGQYRVRVEAQGHDPMARDVTLARAQARTEEFRLKSNTGRVVVTTEPEDVEVILDAKTAGKTKIAEGKGMHVSAPFAIENIAEGKHTLKCIRPGFFESSQEFSISRGETKTIHVELKRRFTPDYEIITRTGSVYRGVLYSNDGTTVRLEINQGVIMPFNIRDLRSHKPLAQ